MNYEQDPAAWAKQLHAPATGKPVEESAIMILIERAIVFEDGVPVFRDPGNAPCVTKINEVARAQPEWAIEMGHLGLARMLAACTAEVEGRVPPGFMNAVAAELQKPPLWKRPWLWMVGGLGALGAAWWMTRRQS